MIRYNPSKQLYALVLLRGLLICIAIIIALYALIGGALYLLYAVNACITEVRQDGIVRANMRFQITETDCSTLGEDASVSVYGFADPGSDRTLLFKYGPANDLPLPTIEVLDQQTIVIAVPSVSDVVFQIDSWNNHWIRYDIGHIYYPEIDGKHAQ
jgi:hypothetical protein